MLPLSLKWGGVYHTMDDCASSFWVLTSLCVFDSSPLQVFLMHVIVVNDSLGDFSSMLDSKVSSLVEMSTTFPFIIL